MRRLERSIMALPLFLLTLLDAAGESKSIISGRVVDEDGVPVAGAALELRDWRSEGEGPPMCEKTFSDATGRFVLSARQTSCRLFVRAEGYAGMFRTHDVFSGKNEGWDFTLRRGAHMSGRIVDTRGAPQVGRMLLLFPVPEPSRPAPGVEYAPPEARGPTDDDGAFALANVAPGTYAILVYRQDRYMQQIPVRGGSLSVEGGESLQNLVFAVHPPSEFRIAGTIRDALGSPAPGIIVTCHQSLHGTGWWTTTDQDGRYQLEGLDGIGTRTVKIHVNASIPIVLPAVSVHDASVDVTLPATGCIASTPLNARTGLAVEDYEVTVQVVLLKGDRRAEADHPTVSCIKQQDGGFVLAGVPAGTATLEVRAPGLGTQRFTVEVVAGQTVPLDCQLLGPSVLEGRTLLDGKPYRVNAVLNGEWKYSDEEGRFRFDNQPNGAVTVWFFGDEEWFRSARAVLNAGQTTQLEMEMGGSSRIQGTAHFPDDPAVSHATVRLAELPAPDGWFASERPDPEERVLASASVSRDNPTYELRNIPAGRHHIMLGLHRPYSYRTEVVSTNVVEIHENQSITLDLCPERNQP